MEDAILAANDSSDARNRIYLAVDTWIKNSAPDMVKAVGLDDDEGKTSYVNSFVNIYKNPWFNYFLHIDPMEYLPKLSCKVLAVNGSKDVQVISKTNLAGIKAGLAKSKVKIHDEIELNGLNHLLQQCNTCTSDEYGALTETISPAALQTIGIWLDKNVKNMK
jgi:hypothetical protein